LTSQTTKFTRTEAIDKLETKEIEIVFTVPLFKSSCYFIGQLNSVFLLFTLIMNSLTLMCEIINKNSTIPQQ